MPSVIIESMSKKNCVAFPELEWEYVLADIKDFQLPPNILTEEIKTARATQRVTRSQRRPTKRRVTYSSSEESFDETSGQGLNKHPQTARQKAASSAVRNKISNNYKHNNNRRTSKQKHVKISDRYIESLPERPPATEPWNARAFVQTPLLKRTTPSTLVKGPFKMVAKQIEQALIERVFSSRVDAWLEAANYLERMDAPQQ